MRMSKKKIAAVVAATSVIALGAGGAYAFVTNASGSASGTTVVASRGTWGVSVLSQTGQIGIGTTATFTFRISNPGPNNARLIDLAPAATLAANGHTIEGTDCERDWLAPAWDASVALDPDGTIAPVDINAGDYKDFILKVSLDNEPVDQTNCLGDTIPFTVVAS